MKKTIFNEKIFDQLNFYLWWVLTRLLYVLLKRKGCSRKQHLMEPNYRDNFDYEKILSKNFSSDSILNS